VARGTIRNVDSFAEIGIRCGLNNGELIAPEVKERDSQDQ
jgi:hypothetical protein